MSAGMDLNPEMDPQSNSNRDSGPQLPSGRPLLPPDSPDPVPDPRRNRRRITRYFFALFTLEVGLFLLIFPWMDQWFFNNVQELSPWLNDIWPQPYFRGALSGLGVVNIYLAVLDLLRTLRGV